MSAWMLYVLLATVFSIGYHLGALVMTYKLEKKVNDALNQRDNK